MSLIVNDLLLLMNKAMFAEDFKRYTYSNKKSLGAEKESHPIHRKMSIQELKKHL